MTPAEITADVRRLVQDALVPYRYSDTTLLAYVNQTLRRMVPLRPDLFITSVDFTLTAGSAEQTLPDTAYRLVHAHRVKNGAAIEEVDKGQFDRAYPRWPLDPAGPTTKFMRHPRNPRAFFVYPTPSSGIILDIEYVTPPPVYTMNDNITVLSDAFFGAIVDGVVYLVESMDDEHVQSGRAKLFLDSFVATLGTSAQTNDVVDDRQPATGGGQA